MNAAEPLETLFEKPPLPGDALPLPDELAGLYGDLSFNLRPAGPLVIGNFVSTLDGVVSLEAGKSGGGAISGHLAEDLMVMGLLRAVSDAVIEGAGTLRTSPQSVLSPGDIFPQLEKPYAELRRRLRKPKAPLNVIVTESGDLDPKLRIFSSGEVEVLVLSGEKGLKNMAQWTWPAWVERRLVPGEGRLDAKALIQALAMPAGSILLAEGGPSLLGSLLKSRLLHELFLTLAPQVAGRSAGQHRPGLVMEQSFAPEDPCWGRCSGIKKSGDHLFLRYAF